MKKDKRRDKWTLSKWKKEARKVFQKYIRLRDSDKKGICVCVTCGKEGHWKEMNGGHFIPAERLSVCFDERNCHVQCVYCNKGLQGNTDAYFVWMEHIYGRKVIDELMETKNKLVKYKYFDYEEIIDKYLDKCVGEEIRMEDKK